MNLPDSAESTSDIAVPPPDSDPPTIPPQYEFLPGRGSHYSGRIRAFVLRKQKTQRQTKQPRKDKEPPKTQLSNPVIPFADAQRLLQSQMDPFQTLATRTNRLESVLLHHYVESCIPNLGRRRQESFFPPRDIDWQLIRQDALGMTAAIQFAAMSFAILQSTHPDSLALAAEYRGKALTAVRERLQVEISNPSDSLIHALIGLLAVDTHVRQKLPPNSEDNLDMHIRGLRAALESRYGGDLSKANSTIHWELLWQNLVCGGKLLHSKTAFSAHLLSMLGEVTPQSLLSGSLLPSQWDFACSTEFIGAYKDFYELAVERLSSTTEPPIAVEEASPSMRPHTLFLRGTDAYYIMSSGVHNVVPTMTPIILINIYLYSLRKASEEELAYQYWALRKKFKKCDVDLKGGTAFLTFAVGMEPDMKSWTDPSSMTLLARIVSVMVRLSDATQRRLESSLLSLITATTLEDAAEIIIPENVQTMVLEGVNNSFEQT